MNVFTSALVLHLALEKYEWKSHIVFELVYIDLHVSHVSWWIVAFYSRLLGNMLLRIQS